MEGRNSGNFLKVRYWSCHALFKTLVLLGFCLILVKAFRLQVIEQQLWVERARAQTESALQVPNYRGSIFDVRGRLLSYSVPQQSLYTDSEQVDAPRKLAAQLVPILGESESTLEKKLASGRRFLWLKRQLTDQQALAVQEIKGRGLNLVREYKRFYPRRQVGGQVIGFVGLDGVGLEGVEKGCDILLRQKGVNAEQVRDGVKKCLWLGASPPPEPCEGLSVRLTVDAYLQYVAEMELEKCVLQYKARAGEVVVMDVQSSEILAMANWPFFDPNLVDKSSADCWRNRCITDSFEPGSTFKVFLMSGALEEGLVKPQERIFCENGKCNLAGHTINDVHPYGWLTMSEVIKHSSNIGAAKIALQLGNERYYRYIHGFGFGTRTGVCLPGEVRGLLRPWKRWRPIDLATTGFGQSIGVTALQLNAGIACIANGGEYVQPLIAKELQDTQGKRIKAFKPNRMRRVIQSKTAAQIRDMMRSVTEEGGTGVSAAPEGYTAAGKTGTAQVLDPATRRYASNKYTAIFTGFVPAEQPRLAITVVIHEPHGAIYGGVVAAPVFRNVAAKALPYLGVEPTRSIPPSPLKLRLASASATEIKISSQGESAKGASVMPDLSGLSLKVALQRLNALGVETKVRGSGKVIGQSPQAGAPLEARGKVELELGNS